MSDTPNTFHFEGMTLRDYFAAKALNACIREFWGDPEGTDDMAAAAYQIADAMLAEREKPCPPKPAA